MACGGQRRNAPAGSHHVGRVLRLLRIPCMHPSTQKCGVPRWLAACFGPVRRAGLSADRSNAAVAGAKAIAVSENSTILEE